VAVIFLYLEELLHVPPTLFVQTITGVAVRERIPERVIDDADEIELVDITPHALRQRMQHGNIYPPERAQQALRRFFREGNLGALRELSLRRAATTVERQLEEYMHDHEVKGVWPAVEAVLVGVTEDPRSKHVIRRASRESTRAQTDLVAVFVEAPKWASASPEANEARAAAQPPLRRGPRRGDRPGPGQERRPGPREDRRRPEGRHDRRRPSALGAPQGPAVRIPRA